MSLRHDAFLYDSDDTFVAEMSAHLDAGLRAGARAVAITTQHNVGLLRQALWAGSHRVSYVDREECYRHPANVRAGFDRVVRDAVAAGARRSARCCFACRRYWPAGAITALGASVTRFNRRSRPRPPPPRSRPALAQHEEDRYPVLGRATIPRVAKPERWVPTGDDDLMTGPSCGVSPAANAGLTTTGR